MAKFAQLKKLLKDSPLPGEVQGAIIDHAKEHHRKKGGTEDEASTATVQKFHDIVDEDMRAARTALRQK